MMSPGFLLNRVPHRRRHLFAVLVLCFMLSAPMFALAAEESDEDDAGEIDWAGGTLTVLNLVAEGDFEEACLYFDEDLSKMITPKQLAKAWEAVQEDLGPFKSFGNARVTRKDDLHLVDVDAKFTWRSGVVYVVWDADGALAGFRVAPAKEKEPTKAEESAKEKPSESIDAK